VTSNADRASTLSESPSFIEFLRKNHPERPSFTTVQAKKAVLGLCHAIDLQELDGKQAPNFLSLLKRFDKWARENKPDCWNKPMVREGYPKFFMRSNIMKEDQAFLLQQEGDYYRTIGFAMDGELTEFKGDFQHKDQLKGLNVTFERYCVAKDKYIKSDEKAA